MYHITVLCRHTFRCGSPFWESAQALEERRQTGPSTCSSGAAQEKCFAMLWPQPVNETEKVRMHCCRLSEDIPLPHLAPPPAVENVEGAAGVQGLSLRIAHKQAASSSEPESHTPRSAYERGKGADVASVPSFGTPQAQQQQQLQKAALAQPLPLDASLAALLQDAAQSRLRAAACRAGSGRQITQRRLDITLPTLAPPPTPYMRTPEARVLADGNMQACCAACWPPAHPSQQWRRQFGHWNLKIMHVDASAAWIRRRPKQPRPRCRACPYQR